MAVSARKEGSAKGGRHLRRESKTHTATPEHFASTTPAADPGSRKTRIGQQASTGTFVGRACLASTPGGSQPKFVRQGYQRAARATTAKVTDVHGRVVLRWRCACDAYVCLPLVDTQPGFAEVDNVASTQVGVGDPLTIHARAVGRHQVGHADGFFVDKQQRVRAADRAILQHDVGPTFAKRGARPIAAAATREQLLRTRVRLRVEQAVAVGGHLHRRRAVVLGAGEHAVAALLDGEAHAPVGTLNNNEVDKARHRLLVPC